MKTTHPTFAVVGHPNKGKSSIVASLAFDDSVEISNTPGTTTKKRSFPLRVDGKVLYELIDTPGFQRARRVLAWLQQHDVPAPKKREVVLAFIQKYRNDPYFNDEIELLSPIMEGAGIIYVVDTSKPYGKEYEIEMEILRWTGEPSMALMNQIESSDYSAEWRLALDHYFKMVRSFNPMEITPAKHIAILESMAQLKEVWIAPVKESIQHFQAYQHQKLTQSATAITALLSEALSLVTEQTLPSKEATEEQREVLLDSYQTQLRQLELASQKRVEQIWSHTKLNKSAPTLPFEGMDLFSKESEAVFGLTRQELLVTSATSGAVSGAGIDLLFGGHTMLLGAGIGAVVGSVGAYFGFAELGEIKVLGSRLGRYTLAVGPMESRNFPYILLGRALYHARQIAHHSHAKREAVDIAEQSGFKEQWLSRTLRGELEGYHKKFRSGKPIKKEDIRAYEALVVGMLEGIVSF